MIVYVYINILYIYIFIYLYGFPGLTLREVGPDVLRKLLIGLLDVSHSFQQWGFVEQVIPGLCGNRYIYIYTVFGICSFGTMGTLLSCNKQIGWICLSLPWNQMGPHPLGVLLRGLLRGAFLASKWASHHTSRGDMYIIHIYIYISELLVVTLKITHIKVYGMYVLNI